MSADQREKKPKICPLLSIYWACYYEDAEQGMINCVRRRCAWWTETAEYGECVLKKLDWLERMAKK